MQYRVPKALLRTGALGLPLAPPRPRADCLDLLLEHRFAALWRAAPSSIGAICPKAPLQAELMRVQQHLLKACSPVG